VAAQPIPPLGDYLPPEEPTPPPPPRRPLWGRILGWTFAGIGILLVLIVVGIYVLLHNASFHRYMLRNAIAQTSTALGTKVQARDFKLTWSGISPTLDLYDVVVDGAPPHSTPPLFQMQHARLGVRITSLLHRTWYIDDVVLDSPIVRVYVDPNGQNNLPKTKSSGKSNTDIFDLGIRHAVLNHGETVYNDRKSALDADLREVNFRAGFDPAALKYAGTLEYQDGIVKMANYAPVHSDLKAKFSLTRDEFVLENALLTSGNSHLTLTATVKNYAKEPLVQGTYDAVADSGQFRAILKNASLPTGMLHAQGQLTYDAKPNVPLMNAVVLNGTLSSANLAVNTPSFRGDVRNLGAQYSIANGNLDVRNLHANTLGGVISGSATMRDLSGNTRSQLNLDVRNVSIAAAKQQLTAPSLRNLQASGTLNGNVAATWGKTMDNLVANANVFVNGAAAPAGQQMMPVTGAIHARYNAATKAITLQNSQLRTPMGVLAMNGTLGNASAMTLNLQNVNLATLGSIAGIPSLQQMNLGGIANFNGSVRGSTAAPELVGLLVVRDLRVKGTQWPLLRTNIDAKPSAASLSNALLTAPNGGHINFDLAAALRNWSFTNQSPFRVNLAAANIDVGSLTKAAGVQTQVAGMFNANINAAGTELAPTGQGNLSLIRANFSGQPVQSLTVKFNGTADQLNADLALQIPRAGGATGTLVYYPKQQNYDAQLRAVGIQLDQLQAIQSKNMDLHGVLNLIANGRGNIHNPEFQAALTIPQLRVKNQTMQGITLQTNVANRVANFSLDSRVLETYARARGTLELTGNYNANATFDTQAIPLAPLVAAYAPAQAGNINGQTELHATLRGPLKDKKALEAHVTIPQLAVSYKNLVQVGAAAPIKADYVNGVLNIARSTIRGTDTNIVFEGSVPMTTDAPAKLLLQGNVDLRLASLIDPDVSSSGQLQFDVNSFGARTNPNVEGQLRLVNASFATIDAPLGMSNANGVLTLTKDRLNITSFHGNVGGGDVTATGGVIYRPSLQFDMALAANNIRLLYPEGVRTHISSNMSLSGTPESSLLRGDVRVDQLNFTPDFDLRNFMGQFGGVETPPPAQGFSTNMKIDLGIHSTTGINLVSRTLSLAGSANLRATGTAAQPVILGRVNLTGGDLIFNGNRYVLQGGTIDFVNASETQPVVNVGVNTTVDQYNIQMHFWGPADKLHTNYASDPALPPADIINLIAFGKTAEASAANPTPPGALGAESLVASQVSSQITSRIEKVAGISQLSVDPELGGNGSSPGAKISIQQRVTSKMFVTFSTDVTGTQKEAIKLEYHSSPRVSYDVVRDQNGGFSMTTHIHKVW
jgi:translocation and assembly module TamB